MKQLLPTPWDVPRKIRDRLGDSVGRQRVIFEEGHLLLVLHRPPQPDEEAREGRFFWRSPAGEWNSNAFGAGPAALSRHLEEYDHLLDMYDEQESQAETSEQFFAILTGLAPLQRAARHMHQALQEARRLVPDDRTIINARDRAYELERTAELQYLETKHSLDYVLARNAERQAQAGHQMAIAAHRLNLLAALFFPLATIATVLGMNLKNGLEETAPPIPLLVTAIAGVVLGVILAVFVARPAKTPTARQRAPESRAFRRADRHR